MKFHRMKIHPSRSLLSHAPCDSQTNEQTHAKMSELINVTYPVLLLLGLLLHPFNGLFPGQPRYAGTRKVKPVWNLTRQEIMWFRDDSGIS